MAGVHDSRNSMAGPAPETASLPVAGNRELRFLPGRTGVCCGAAWTA